MELRCAVQNYDWGELGFDSLVAYLASKNDPNLEVDEITPYAELWMGTHPSGESIVKIHEITLREYVKHNPEVLGPTTNYYGSDISFLMKILSVRKALSIQVHPNREKAKALNSQYPKIYTDDNHKPELAVAITEFKALCGFRPLEEIILFLQSIPELCDLIDAEIRHEFFKQPSNGLLKKCFSSYMTASPVEARKSAAKLIDRLSVSAEKVQEVQLASLFNQLNKQFPGDIGLFAIYFLNYVTLEPGEAIFLASGIPHAYLHGDCAEVMARSDNVVRAGLTPKMRDVSTLLDIIVVQPTSAEDIKFRGRSYDKYVRVFKPPVEDFALSLILIPACVKYTLPVHRHGSILAVVKGSAECELFSLDCGVVVFIPADYKVKLIVEKCLEMYQAYPNF